MTPVSGRKSRETAGLSAFSEAPALCFPGQSGFTAHLIHFLQFSELSRCDCRVFSCRSSKENPKEAEIVSHRLMLRAGMIRQEAAGIYAWLPLGFRVLKKIEQIVREEQDRAGALELLMPTLQLADLWRESGRYDAYGPEMLRIADRHKRELLYGPTNEEMITEIFRAYVQVLSQPAAQPLSHPVEVPRRAAPALRRDARPRIPDEGRLFLRHRRGGGAARLQPDVRRLPAHLRAHGAEGDPDARRDRPDRRRPQPRVHRAGRDRRVAASTATATCSTCRSRRRRRLRRRSCADHQAMDLALCGDRGRARRRALRARGAGGQAGARRAASRSARSSTSAPNIPSR